MDVEKHYITKHDKILRLMQMKIEEATPEYARVTMPLLEQHKNGMGVAHGGAIFALADVTFGAASNADRDCGVVNMMSSIEYLRPGRVGPLMAEARAVRIGGHIANYDVQVFDGEGALIARAIVSGYLTDVPLPD